MTEESRKSSSMAMRMKSFERRVARTRVVMPKSFLPYLSNSAYLPIVALSRTVPRSPCLEWLYPLNVALAYHESQPSLDESALSMTSASFLQAIYRPPLQYILPSRALAQAISHCILFSSVSHPLFPKEIRNPYQGIPPRFPKSRLLFWLEAIQSLWRPFPAPRSRHSPISIELLACPLSTPLAQSYTRLSPRGHHSTPTN